MARIRSIKPEFWSSPKLPADPWSRLLYMAMWNWADDNGVGTANPRELLGFAFPNDDDITVADLRRMLVEIRRAFGVVFYEVAGRPYYSIPSWEKHQKFDRRSKGKYPPPDEAESWLYEDETPPYQAEQSTPGSNFECSTDTRGNSTSTRRDSVAGTGEQGNRGTGEKTSRPPVFDVPTDRAPARIEGGDVVPLKAPRGPREVAERWNATAHSSDAHAIVRQYEKHIGAPVPGEVMSGMAQRIDECLASGIDPEQIARGLGEWHASDSWSTSQIPSFVHKAGAKSKPRGSAKPSQAAGDALALANEMIAKGMTRG